MPVSININGGDAAEALKELSALAAGFGSPITKTPSAAPAQEPVAQPQTPPGQRQPAPTQQQYPPQTAVPVATPQQPPAQPPQQAVSQPGPVPTEATTYTMDQLAVAATQLIDAGQQPAVVQLLGQFGVQALTQLPKEQYGAFATALRGLGARI